jgi:two-component system cell cycle sensor histidine kinase/response regulator CckA
MRSPRRGPFVQGADQYRRNLRRLKWLAMALVTVVIAAIEIFHALQGTSYGQVILIGLVALAFGLTLVGVPFHLAMTITGRLYDELRTRKEAEARYRAVVETQVEALCRWRPDTTLTFVNGHYCSFYGKTEEELIGRKWIALVPAEEQEEVLRFYRETTARAKSVTYTHRVVAADGSWRWQEWTDTPILDDEGRVVEVQSVGRDVTERVRALQTETRLATLLEGAGEAILIVDALGRIEFANPAFERSTGYAQEEVQGQPYSMLEAGPGDPQAQRGLWEALSQGRSWQGRTHCRNKDGSLRDVEVDAIPVRGSDGQTTEYVLVSRDVTNEVALEERLRQTSKMEAVGRLAGGVAHDFNNVLVVIEGYASLLLEVLSAGQPLDQEARERMRADVAQIIQAGERAASLTRQLLAFSRKQVLRPETLHLNAVVKGLEGMVRRLIGEDVELETALAPDLGWTRADPGQLGQVIVNLAANARDAMPTGGRLTIATGNVTLDEGQTAAYADLDAGPYVLLQVEDTGVGMDERTRSRLFEPFFTTKERGQGTGLGLATVYGIVRQSKGMIEVESAPGEGSTFQVYFPRIPDPARTAAAGTAPDVERETGERILIVEDEGDVRGVTQRILERAGYQVHAVPSAEAALAYCEQSDHEIDLLLTDVVMEGEMSGHQLAQRLLRAGRVRRVLHMSGYTDDVLVRYGVLHSRISYLEKPFTPDALCQHVREALEGNGLARTRSA